MMPWRHWYSDGSVRNAQLCFLGDIGHRGKVLILGGGTGWLLVELLRVNPDCEVWYIEASSAMIRRARSKINDIEKARVHFINGTEAHIPTHLRYDTIIANFYFDLFSASSLEKVLGQIRSVISHQGKLHVSDFTNNSIWWQSALLSGMYFFFRVLCGIEATDLPDWQRQISKYKFEHKSSRLFYGKFIKSVVFEIREHTPAVEV